jgi:hypothetical protein
MKTFQSVPFFYEPQANDTSAANTEGVMTFAELMAQPETTPAAEPSPEPTPEPTDAATPSAEPTPEPTATPAPTPKPEPIKDWRETVSNDDLINEVKKKLDRTALLKAAGIDDEVIKAIEYKESNGGNWDEYLQVKGTDYEKIGFEKLIEMDLREKYKGLDNNKFNIVLKNELKKYNLDRNDYEEDSEEAILGGIMLEKDAAAIKAKYIEKQNSLKAPEKIPDNTAQVREQFQQQVAATVRNSETVKNLSAKNLISFGEGEEVFNYEIKDARQLIDTAISVASNNDSLPDEAQIRETIEGLALFANKAEITKALINHGKILGERAVRKEAANVTPGGQTVTPVTQTGVTNIAFKKYSDIS